MRGMLPVDSQWEAVLAEEPSDWSHLYLELRVDDADRMEEAGLILCPLNPWHGDSWRSGVLRFRVARSHGYGASPEITRAMLRKLDAAGIAGELAVLDGFDSVLPVGTQGPV